MFRFRVNPLLENRELIIFTADKVSLPGITAKK